MIRIAMLTRAIKGENGLGSAFDSGRTIRFMITHTNRPYTTALARIVPHGNTRGKTKKYNAVQEKAIR
ncbi:hypothetical protein GCM10028810_08330 [Spirosoma litoris]